MNRSLKILFAMLTLGLATSCYYTPYDSYSSGFSTGGTSFVYTSNDRWLYDPAIRCYYDRQRSCYYDPWLNGYYPSGYAPRPVYGVPHPYGWNGRGNCPVPRSVRYTQIDRYNDRVDLLRARNYQWAQQVRARNDVNIARFQANRAQQAANFRQAQAAQQQRNEELRQRIRENQQRNQQNWQTPSRPSGPDPRRAAPAPQNNRRAGFNQPVNVGETQARQRQALEQARARNAANQQAIRERNAANQQAARARQAEARQKYQDNLEKARQRMRNR